MQSFNVTTTATETAYVISLPESGTDYEIIVCAEGQSGISYPSVAWTENSCEIWTFVVEVLQSKGEIEHRVTFRQKFLRHG